MKNPFKAKLGLHENVEYVLRDDKGKPKKLFQPNRLYLWLLKRGLASPNLTYRVFGRFTDKMVISNLITTVGVSGIAARINGSGSPAAYTYIALGTGTTAAADANTQLEAEITTSGGARASASVSLQTTDTAGDTAQLQNTFNFTTGASFAITESGVLNAASSGTLLARQVFSAINVVSGDSLQVTLIFRAIIKKFMMYEISKLQEHLNKIVKTICSETQQWGRSTTIMGLSFGIME